ncbi:MAG: hypothetical protein CAPSK01_001662 [Candidatus Accumulibacter vicinus]|uniref:Uncharacterized protein n=1 Tax=Candidatus Accumulibacter vicinus TaxID=2954382 RepID=A0A084Y263_9PROT|nr:MAG: hypothetical protein CAPSK01_001662 [Candidatus Accumulibacter vicinus]
MLLDRQRVEEGLERAARLPPRRDAVHLTGARQAAAGTYPGEDFTGEVVEHEQRAVLDMASVQFAQVPRQRLDGKALHACVQRTHQPLSRDSEQPAREMRRIAADGVPRWPVPQSLRRQRLDQQAFFRIHAERQQCAGPARNLRQAGIRRAHQRRQQGTLAAVQPRRPFAEQRTRSRVNPFEFPAKRREVEPRFQHLVLAP